MCSYLAERLGLGRVPRGVDHPVGHRHDVRRMPAYMPASDCHVCRPHVRAVLHGRVAASHMARLAGARSPVTRRPGLPHPYAGREATNYRGSIRHGDCGRAVNAGDDTSCKGTPSCHGRARPGSPAGCEHLLPAAVGRFPWDGRYVSGLAGMTHCRPRHCWSCVFPRQPPLGERAAALEFCRHRIVNRAGSQFCLYRIRVGRFQPIARISCFDCPLCQIGQVLVRLPHWPSFRKQVLQSVQVVGGWKIDLFGHQGCL